MKGLLTRLFVIGLLVVICAPYAVKHHYDAQQERLLVVVIAAAVFAVSGAINVLSQMLAKGGMSTALTGKRSGRR